MPSRPNILFIFPDQQRGDTLGCVGHSAVQTPNLDKIAAEGVLFTACYTKQPVTGVPWPGRSPPVPGGDAQKGRERIFSELGGRLRCSMAVINWLWK